MFKLFFKKVVKSSEENISSIVQHNITFDRLNNAIEKEVNRYKPENQAEELRKRLSVVEPH